MIKNISPIITVSNSERTLEKCLASLSEFAEIVLYLNNTKDNSKLIARKFRNVTIYEGEFLGYADSKNKAAGFANNDWVFSIDSDEWLDQKIIDSLKSIDLTDRNVIYRFKHYNYYMGKLMRGGEFKSTYMNRLYNRVNSKWHGMIHERLTEENKQIIHVKGRILHHDPLPDKKDPRYKIFIQRINLKRTKYASLNKKKKIEKMPKILLILYFSIRFINLYFIRYGFIDGKAGLYSNYRSCKCKYDAYTKPYDISLETAKIDNISAVVIVSNAEKYLKFCLDSLRDFTEVVVYINNTTDSSKEIARKYSNVKIYEGDFLGYSESKNKAAMFATNEWIFSIDADEWVDEILLNNLRLSKNLNPKNIIKMKRFNYYMGKIIIGGYDRPTWKTRLYNRNSSNWIGAVHEKLVTVNCNISKMGGGHLPL